MAGRRRANSIPDLNQLPALGVAEVAQVLGWPRNRVAVYQHRGLLPKPWITLACGPIWRREDIVAYQVNMAADPVAQADGGESRPTWRPWGTHGPDLEVLAEHTYPDQEQPFPPVAGRENEWNFVRPLDDVEALTAAAIAQADAAGDTLRSTLEITTKAGQRHQSERATKG